MANGYYVYVLDDAGHITNRINVVCEDDDEAKRCAKQLVDGHAIELWQETRMIATFQPPGLNNESSDS
jgi:hypothetical protein